MFNKKNKKPKAKKSLDAQVIPIEDRVEHLEKIAASNEESKVAMLEAIDAELAKISKTAKDTPRCRKK